MDKALAIFEQMEPITGGYDYRKTMARDVKQLIFETWPARAHLLQGRRSKDFRDDFRDIVFSHLQACGAYAWLGIGKESPLMQWQYKSFVKRAGAAVLEKACQSYGISRQVVINAIFSNDWRTLDSLIRWYFLGDAVELAIDEIQMGGQKK